MLKIRFVDIPARLTPFIERAVIVDLRGAADAQWRFLPTGCFGVSLLTQTDDQEDLAAEGLCDGSFCGVVSKVTATRCDRSCLALGLSLTPLGVLHLPLHTHDFESCFAVGGEVIFGHAAWRRVHDQVRDAQTADAKMTAFMSWMEIQLADATREGRAAALAEVAQRMRSPHPPTMLESAQLVGLQRRQFERDFRHHFGISPKKYAKVARVQQVAQLAWRGMGLAGIAAELGFADQAHMCHAVKEVTGMTPTKLLKWADESPLVRATRPFSGGRITHL